MESASEAPTMYDSPSLFGVILHTYEASTTKHETTPHYSQDAFITYRGVMAHLAGTAEVASGIAYCLLVVWLSLVVAVFAVLMVKAVLIWGKHRRHLWGAGRKAK